MDTRLVPLRVPSGWAVLLNHFAEEDPVVVGDSIINDLYFSEDILWIHSMRLAGDNFELELEGYSLDLGWYPASDPNGKYKLRFMRRNWENIIVETESVNRQEIRAVAELCLSLASEGIEDAELSRKIAEFKS